MQDLKSLPSVSDSVKTDADSEGVLPYINGHTSGALEEAPPSAPPELPNGAADRAPFEDLLVRLAVDPVAEPDFLAEPEPAGPEPVDMPYIPSPDESTVAETPRRSRSLRMQYRFARTIVFAGVLFARLLFWQVYVRRYFPAYVDRTNMGRWKRYAREFRHFAGELGGVFIKLGQFISTRYDILPEEILRELEGLQDEVPTIPFNRIRMALEAELGPVSERYRWFNEVPIAAASLGQVHKAHLLNGEKVVVKVQRPGIREICYTDLAAMRVVARVAMRFQFISRRSDAVALVDEFGKVLLEELSYKHEAYNAYRFAEMFRNHMGVYIPAIYHEHSTDQVLTIEDVTSIKLNDYEALERAKISRKAVADRLMETYLDQVFVEYFFHADPHPGNLFIYPLPVEDEMADFGRDGRPFYLIFVDFGMTGTLTREIANGMVSTLSAILTRDHKRLVKSYVDLGFILPGADIRRIEEATKIAFDQVWGLSMTDMRDLDFDSVAHLADEFNDLIFSMPFYIPQDFIYLGRTLSILSGMCTSLDPDFNPWDDLLPYTERLLAKGFGGDVPASVRLGGQGLGGAVLQSLFNGSGGQVLSAAADELLRRTFPPVARADDVLQQMHSGELRVIVEPSLVYKSQLKRLEKESRRTQRAIFFGSVLVVGTLFYVNGDTTLALLAYGLAMTVVLAGALRD